jgi:hypothetical protein
VVSEFEKLDKVDPKTEINLWFEFELFCQTNLWFILNLLQEKNLTNVYRVLPIIKESKDIWKGFGNFGEVELEKCYSERIKLAKKDIDFGAILWKAYKASDLKELKQLSESKSKAFPFLEEVCRAEIERKQNNRVNKSLQEIIVSGAKDFSEVFIQFQEKEGVYGFGDLQVKNNYQQLVSK